MAQSAKRSGRTGGGGRSRSADNGRRKGGRKASEYPDYEIRDLDDIGDEPDVMLDVPVLKVDEIDVEVDDLRAAVSVRAELKQLVQLNVGVAARLGKVELNIQGVEAQALLKARLDNVAQILGRVLTTLDRNPDLLESVGRAVEDVGQGAGGTLRGAGEAVESVGKGGGEAVGQIGEGAGQAAGQVGQGASQALEGVGQGAGQAAGQLGQGAGQAVQGVGEGGDQALQGVGKGVKKAGKGGGS